MPEPTLIVFVTERFQDCFCFISFVSIKLYGSHQEGIFGKLTVHMKTKVALDCMMLMCAKLSRALYCHDFFPAFFKMHLLKMNLAITTRCHASPG